MAVVREFKIGNTTIKINDECVVDPERNEMIWQNIARIAATCMQKQELENKSKESAPKEICHKEKAVHKKSKSR